MSLELNEVNNCSLELDDTCFLSTHLIILNDNNILVYTHQEEPLKVYFKIRLFLDKLSFQSKTFPAKLMQHLIFFFLIPRNLLSL